MSRTIPLARRFTLFCAFAVLLSGCNLFSGIHQDGRESNASVLVADGRAALARGDYANAAHYFENAIQNDPRNSEARMGYAEAYLKLKGYNFGNLMKTMMKADSSNPSSFLNLQDWGCQSNTELADMFSTLVGVLDPIACGQTSGPYPRNDVNVNFSVGIFYMLRAAAQALQVSSSFTLQEMQKSATSAAALGITQAQFDLLPDKFYWLSNHPPLALLNQLQNDMSQGVARLHVAAIHSAYPDQLEDVVDKFESLQIQTQP